MPPMHRVRRLLVLALALCALVALFFLLYGQSWRDAPIAVAPPTQHAAAAQTLSSRDHRHVIEGPDPSHFTHFTYRGGSPSHLVEGVCASHYAAVMVYPSAIDYRESPLDATYNIALPCPPSGRYAREIDLAAYSFGVDDEYYVIRADQGESGPWYNPQ